MCIIFGSNEVFKTFSTGLAILILKPEIINYMDNYLHWSSSNNHSFLVLPKATLQKIKTVSKLLYLSHVSLRQVILTSTYTEGHCSLANVLNFLRA